MKNAKVFCSVLLLAFTFGMQASFAQMHDFSLKTNDELNSMRGKMQTATDAEKEAFKAEWQKRVGSMTPEERERYLGRPAAAQQTTTVSADKSTGPAIENTDPSATDKVSKVKCKKGKNKKCATKKAKHRAAKKHHKKKHHKRGA